MWEFELGGEGWGQGDGANRFWELREGARRVDEGSGCCEGGR